MASVCNAVLGNDIAELAKIIKKGERFDIPDNLGYTVLHYAVDKSNIECVKLLLEHPSCPINLRSIAGHTSLHLACRKESPHIKIIKSLLENGADPNIGDNTKKYPLHKVCANGNLNIAKMLLEYGADINVQGRNHYTPLHYAVSTNQKLMVEYLLKCGANTSLTNMKGFNPLMVSIKQQYEDIFYMLLPLTKDLNQRTRNKISTIELAISEGNYNMVRSIVNRGTLPMKALHKSLEYDLTYEMRNLEIFKFIWSKVNHKLLFKDGNMVDILFFTMLNIYEHIEHIKIIFQTENLNLGQRLNIYNIYNIFWGKESPNKEHFLDKMDKLICILKSFGNQVKLIVVQMIKGDISISNYFKHCPYKDVLITAVLSEANISISEEGVLDVFSLNHGLGLGSLYLQYCSHLLNPSEFFKFILECYNDYRAGSEKCLTYFLKFHTPRVTVTQYCLKQETMISPHIRSLFETLSGKVKTLTELSRDVVRGCVGCCLLDQNKHVNMVDFMKAINGLDCPLDVKYILQLKRPVNIL